jgi:hypothetical protein
MVEEGWGCDGGRLKQSRRLLGTCRSVTASGMYHRTVTDNYIGYVFRSRDRPYAVEIAGDSPKNLAALTC